MASLSSIVACCWWLIIPYCRRVIAALIIDTPRAYDSIPLTMGSVGGFRVSWSGITDDNNKNPRTNMTMELYLIRGDMVVVASWVRTLNTSSSNGSLLLPVNSTMMMPPFEAYYYLQLFVNKDHLQQQVAIQGPISFYLHANTTTATSSTFLVIPTATPSPYFTTDPAETSTHFIIDASTTSTTLLAAATTDAILDDESTLVSPTTRAALEGAAIAATTVIVVALVSQLDLSPLQSIDDDSKNRSMVSLCVVSIAVIRKNNHQRTRTELSLLITQLPLSCRHRLHHHHHHHRVRMEDMQRIRLWDTIMIANILQMLSSLM